MSKTKRLIIDGQVFQSEARDRGMGRYSVCLIKELLRHSHYTSIEFVLTRHIAFDSAAERELQQIFPGVSLHYLDLTTTKKGLIDEQLTHNKRVLNSFISRLEVNRDETDFLIPSPFQEPFVSVFPDNTKKLMLFYDLIPYLYHQRYEPIMFYESYLKRFRSVFEADCIFTISESVADDLQTYIGLPKERLICIDGAPIRTDHTKTKPQFADLPKSFILMPTSDDPRKNNIRAILGFEEFRLSQPDLNIKLVITSKIRQRERQHMELFSKNLVFTGNIPESELNWLYEKCDLVLFVPESEGLGLPVLEAAEAGKMVVCSDIPVFKEISKTAFHYCDHENQQSISNALRQAFAARSTKGGSKEYSQVLAHYSWPATAKRFEAGNLQVHQRQERTNKPKIAIFTPAPEGMSAIGKVVAESHPAMSEYFDIDYYAERGLYANPVRPNYLQYVVNKYSHAEAFGVKDYQRYDAVVYHIGNGDYHLESIKNSLYLPGYAIVHDTNITEAFRVLNETGMIDKSRVKLEELLDKTNKNDTSSFLTSVLTNQLGTLTHSAFAKQAVKHIVGTKTPIIAANLPTAVVKYRQRNKKGPMVVGLAGIIADVKGIAVIERIAQDAGFADVKIRLFGFSHATKETIERLNAYENVEAITNLTDFEFQNSISKLDVFINYRTRYNGETSLSTIEAMRQGVVVFVKNVGWYSELPDDTVVKVESEEDILTKLKELQDNTTNRHEISVKAHRYIEANFSHEQYAKKLLRLIKSPTSARLSNVAKELKAGSVRFPAQYIRKFNKDNGDR